MKTKCAIYCRVSTSGQDVSTQVDSLKEYAERMGWEIYRIYIDEALTGKLSIDERPEANRLFKDIVDQNFNILLSDEQDRITRTENRIERALIEQTVIDNNIKLHSPGTGETDLTTYSGEVVYAHKAIMSAYELKRIRERTSRGRRKKLEQGIPMGSNKNGGEVIFGRRLFVNNNTGEVKYKNIDDKINKVRRAGKLIVEEGYGIRKAAEAVGLAYNTLHRILHNHSGSTFKQRNQDQITGEVKTFTFTLPEENRIFPDEYVQKIKEAFKRNKTNVGPKRKNPLLFSGLLRYDHKIQRVLNTMHNTRRRYVFRGDRCKPKKPVFYIRADKIDNSLLEDIAHHLSFDSKLFEAVNGGSKQSDRRKVLEKEIKGLRAEIKANDREFQNLKNYIKKYGKDLDEIAVSEINKDINKSVFEKKDLKYQLEKKQAELKSLPSPEDIKEKQKKIWHFVDSMSTKQKIKLKKKRTSEGKAIPIPDFTDEINRMRFQQKILDLDFNAKRKFLKKFFKGKDLDNKMYGIYVDRLDDGTINYVCYGNLNLGYFSTGNMDYKSNNINNVNCSMVQKHRNPYTDQTGRKTCRTCPGYYGRT